MACIFTLTKTILLAFLAKDLAFTIHTHTGSNISHPRIILSSQSSIWKIRADQIKIRISSYNTLSILVMLHSDEGPVSFLRYRNARVAMASFYPRMYNHDSRTCLVVDRCSSDKCYQQRKRNERQGKNGDWVTTRRHIHDLYLVG